MSSLRIRMPALAPAGTRVWINVGGTWRAATPFIRIGGVWRQATPFINVGGTWR